MRETPRQLSSPDLGSPKKVWNLLCEKDEATSRNVSVFNRHPHINPKMRTILLEWLIEVCHDQRLHRETFHLAVDYLDKLLHLMSNILPQQLQLIGSTSLVIAMKMEEIYPPKISTIAHLTDGCCSESEICGMEQYILHKLEWKCTPITTIHWLALYLQLMSTAEPQEPFPSNRKTAALHFRRASQHVSDIGCNTSDSHFYPDQRCTVSKLMRDEFIRLATVVDLVTLDTQSMQFRYRELAAAVIWCCYEPDNLLQEITGFRRDELQHVLEYVEPFVIHCEKLEPTGIKIPLYMDINADDAHNIQSLMTDAVKHLELINNNRRKKSEKWPHAKHHRTRKRKICVINNFL